MDDLSAKRYSVPIPGIVAPASELQHALRTVHVLDLRLHAGLPLLEHGLALRIRGRTLCTHLISAGNRICDTARS